MTQTLNKLFAIVWRQIKANYIFILLFLLIFPAIRQLLLPGYFGMHDDLQVLRLYELNKCFKDWQIPCRWVPDAGYGYGYPLMQFYPPMPYYPMYLLFSLGLGYFWSVKIIFALAFVVSGYGMYYLTRQFFGKWGGVLSALFYVYAPYHSVDIYVRGAMNEAWGMAWFPFVLLYIYKLIKEKFSWKNFYLFAVFLSLQLTSHNVMTLVFAPSALIWTIFWLVQSRQFQTIKSLVLSGLLGMGLSAFFFFPVALESKYVHVDSMMSGYFNYMAHYADLNQLFITRFWGYGGSTWGPNDDMSFSVGHFQWVVALLGSLLAVIRFKKNKTQSLMIFMISLFGLAYAFLAHSRSLPVWERLPLLQYAQFPWRLVALIVFYFSFTAGYLATLTIPKLVQKLFFLILVLGLIIWNLPFFRVEKPIRVTFEEKTAGKQWDLQVTGGIFDYLPRSAPVPPGDPAFTIPQYVSGLGGILNFQKGSNWMQFEANVSSNSAQIMLPLYTYPGLVTKLDSKKVITVPDKKLGRVLIEVPQGTHLITAKVGSTPIRMLSDIISFSSLVILFAIIFYDRRQSK